MVKTINKSVCRGVAGKRYGKVKGVVIHNTADNLTATQHMNRLGNMNNKQLEAGFAHYFIDESTIVRTEDTYNMAWHTANPDGNANYIGYEVCRSTGSQSNFLQAEQNTFKQVAEDLKFYGLPANRNTVRLHREFVPTACPHRSWDLHGKSVNAVKDYFIKEINKYMKGNASSNKPSKPSKPNKPSKTIEQLANEVIAGKHGSGEARKKSLGKQYSAVQKRVNEKLGVKPNKPQKKSIDTIAREVIRGDWGNGQSRYNRLKKAGYNPDAVQRRVNQLM